MLPRHAGFRGPGIPRSDPPPPGCRLPSRPPAARAEPLATLGSPDWRAARRQAAIGTGIGRDRALSMMHSTPIAWRMTSPGLLCTKSALNTPGLGSGAGGGVLSTIRRDTPGTNSPRPPGPGAYRPPLTPPTPSHRRHASPSRLSSATTGAPLRTQHDAKSPGCADCLSRPWLMRQGSDLAPVLTGYSASPRHSRHAPAQSRHQAPPEAPRIRRRPPPRFAGGQRT